MIDDRTTEPLITAGALLEAGYRETSPHVTLDRGVKRMFQRAFDDATGRRYFVTFREWEYPVGDISYEAQIACETASGGIAWVTIKEPTLAATQDRAGLIWRACGGCYYDARQSDSRR